MHATRTACPRLSIGVPVFNGERYLAEALDSLLQQTFQDFEIVISDNASTDATPEICAEYARRDERISYVRQPYNVGAAANYNRTFELAQGELFKWAAHDDRCAPQFLQRCVEALDEAGSRAVLAYSPAATIDADGAFIVPDPYANGDELRPTGSLAVRRLIHALQHLDMVNAVFGVIRSQALASTRLIDRFVASDYVLVVELAMLGEFARLDERLLERRKHPGGSRHEANPTLVDVARWFDGRQDRRRTLLPTRVRLTIEYMRSALRLPLPVGERLLCLLAIAPAVLLARTRVLLGRLRRSLLAPVPGSSP